MQTLVDNNKDEYYFHFKFVYVIRNVDLREYLTEEAQATEKSTTYDLVANVVHDGKPSEGAYRIHVLHHVRLHPDISKISLISSSSNHNLTNALNYVLIMSLIICYISWCLIRELGSGMRCKTSR